MMRSESTATKTTMTKPQNEKPRGPGKTALVLFGALIVAGTGTAWILAHQGVAMAWGLMAGWLGAGLIGLSGLWTMKKALSGGNKTFLKYVLGGMLVRLILCGTYAGISLGMEWFEQTGFVVGLLAGIAMFLVIEITGLARSARLLSSNTADCSVPVEGVTSRG
jgi:hypothetical protein